MKESILRVQTDGFNKIAESIGNHTRSYNDAANATVFLSHHHNDRELVMRVKYLLEKLDARVYIDWLDSDMPAVTSLRTAEELKARIRKCDKFIFLATDGAIESKWCNWELGQGDALKFDYNKIAILPVEPDHGRWIGEEYLNVYPEIVYRDGKSTDKNGKPIEEGYYYRSPERKLTPLVKWLKKE